jgi:hypothetical protein
VVHDRARDRSTHIDSSPDPPECDHGSTSEPHDRGAWTRSLTGSRPTVEPDNRQPTGAKARLSVRAAAYGTVAGALSGLAATRCSKSSGISGVLGSWTVYVLGIAGLLGVLLQ